MFLSKRMLNRNLLGTRRSLQGGRIDLGAFESSPPPVVDGDFHDDGVYDCVDIDSLVAEIASGANTITFDLTGDELVDTADLTAWREEAGSINLGSGNAYPPGDADLDGTIDGTDFGIWNANKFTSADNGSAHAVPEPTFCWWVLMLGVGWAKRPRHMPGDALRRGEPKDPRRFR